MQHNHPENTLFPS